MAGWSGWGPHGNPPAEAKPSSTSAAILFPSATPGESLRVHGRLVMLSRLDLVRVLPYVPKAFKVSQSVIVYYLSYQLHLIAFFSPAFKDFAKNTEIEKNLGRLWT